MTGHQTTPPDWSVWLPTSLYDALMRIERRIGEIAGRQEAEASETRRHLDRQDQQLNQIEQRVIELERRPNVSVLDPPQKHRHWTISMLHDLRSFLRSVGSPREWVFGALIVVLALKGAIAPEEARRWLSAVIGLPLT